MLHHPNILKFLPFHLLHILYKQKDIAQPLWIQSLESHSCEQPLFSCCYGHAELSSVLRYTSSLTHMAVIRSALGDKASHSHNSREGQEDPPFPKLAWIQTATYLLQEGTGAGAETLHGWTHTMILTWQVLSSWTLLWRFINHWKCITEVNEKTVIQYSGCWIFILNQKQYQENSWARDRSSVSCDERQKEKKPDQ